MDIFTSKHRKLSNILNCHKCKKCRGSGELNDADPGDTSFHTWFCDQCDATGVDNYAELIMDLVAEFPN